MGPDRSTWLISGIARAAIGVTWAMVLYANVSHNSSWEWDLSLPPLALGFAEVALAVVVITGRGPFAHLRVNTAGSTGESSGSGAGRALRTKATIQLDHLDHNGGWGRQRVISPPQE